MTRIYKVLDNSEWEKARSAGLFSGSPIDIEDGYIHFSTASQVVETVAKHFHGQTNLVLVTVDAEDLGDTLKWEPSRGGDLFPHLYGSLDVALALEVQALGDRGDGGHDFPEQF